MKKRIRSLLLLITIGAFHANAQFSLTGEIRPRTELYGGTNSRLLNDGDALGVATQQRSRLYFNYVDSTGLKIVFSPQVVNFWGQEPQAYDLLFAGSQGGLEPIFSVFEAYAEYQASDWYTLKIGRQAISYYDQRWFGALGWAASGRSHDALVNKLTLGKVKLDIGVALNRTGHSQGFDPTAFNTRKGYHSMQYLWAEIPAGDLTLRTMVTNVIRNTKAVQDSVEYSTRTTLGLLPTYKTTDITANLSIYLQYGEELSSSLFAADVTYVGFGIPITLGADIVSGNDVSSTDNETWQQPFGTNHKFYGLMDFFYVGETPTFGLNDYYAKAVFKTGESSKLVVMPHIFTTNRDFIPEGETEIVGGYLGTEIDLVYDLNVSRNFNFKLGYSTIFADELFESFKAGSSDEFNQWAWMQLTFKPKFL